MDDQLQTSIISLVERALNLLDKWIERKYPPIKEEKGEVWRKGDPLPEPQTVEEYRDFPSDQKGRFQRAIDAARRT